MKASRIHKNDAPSKSQNLRMDQTLYSVPNSGHTQINKSYHCSCLPLQIARDRTLVALSRLRQRECSNGTLFYVLPIVLKKAAVVRTLNERQNVKLSLINIFVHDNLYILYDII